MIRKALWLAVPAGLVGAVMLAAGWPDITRYFKIKSMSAGGGHPEIVPIEGKHYYAESASEGTPDGTGDFDSARRGGPANAVAGPVKPGEARRG
jgi:hypothetical protein